MAQDFVEETRERITALGEVPLGQKLGEIVKSTRKLKELEAWLVDVRFG